LLTVPKDLKAVIEEAWEATKPVPGYLLENEGRFLGVLAAITPAQGAIVEIGSYRGRFPLTCEAWAKQLDPC
jgi:hypothetical protein